MVSTADLLLLLSVSDSTSSDDVYFRQGFYPAKTFEYFGVGKPIMCVPGDGGLLDELITRTSTGVILPTPPAIAEFLMAALDDWQHGRRPVYEPDAAEVERYTRRNLARRLAAVLDEVARVNRSEAETVAAAEV